MTQTEQAAAWAKGLPPNHRDAVIRWVTAGTAVLVSRPGRTLLRHGAEGSHIFFAVENGQLVNAETTAKKQKGAKAKV